MLFFMGLPRSAILDHRAYYERGLQTVNELEDPLEVRLHSIEVLFQTCDIIV